MSKKWTVLLTPALLFLTGVVCGAELADIKDARSKVLKVAGGFSFTEGPVWSPAGYLLFSDIPNNRIVKWKAKDKVEDFLLPSGESNGLMFSGDGELYVCQHKARQVSVLNENNELVPVADRFNEKKLNSPNDLALDSNGGLYFTDPRYGNDDSVEQPVMGVYYVDAAGRVTRIVEDLERPNGILVSPDGTTLYVAEPNKRELYRYKIDKPGMISDKKLIFTGDEQKDGGGPDGMAHDVHGNIYATYKGVVVLDPEGQLIGRIEVPEHTSNCAFGGETNKTLFITARTSVYAVVLKVEGMSAKGRQGPAGLSKRRKHKFGEFTIEAPRSWQKVKPRFNFMKLQLEVEALVGDKEPAVLTASLFLGVQGGYGQNAYRWLGAFTPQDRKYTIVKGKCANGDYYIMDIRGSYHRRGNVKPILTARKLGAMIQRADGLYFLEFVGYQSTVSAEEDEFRKLFGADRTTEVPVKREDI
jgi:gluconolactonase